ncbi:aldo/keto reductase [Pseudomonas putida]|uniref:aldo/keto reductase n=1 Tax=Pseudomonas putida TaxID=303 RepID=UPI0002DD3D4C|nr:aldo/keto reductase [Pseudomonas putida]OAS15598.1 oxidoreductase [Pseudomonas putida]
MTVYSPYIPLADGNRIPQLGLGLWKATNEDAANAVVHALSCGYRHIDTAAAYDNEESVGQGIHASGVKRDDIFVTSKVWNSEQGFDTAIRAVDASLKRLKLDHLDLMLVHWPCPQKGLFIETWLALIQAQQQGKIKSIGVSNFTEAHLNQLIEATRVVPVINQIELHPYLQQNALRAAHDRLGIRTESWSPLGQGSALTDPVITSIAQKHQRTPAQVIIRWHVQQHLVVIPKSITPERISANAAVFDFALDSQDLAAIASLDNGTRIGPDPLTFA